MTKYAIALIFCYMTVAWLGCKKDSTKFLIVPPSAGDTTTLLGIAGIERGDSAYRSVFVDLSKEVSTPVLRSGWDLGFYCGTEFRVIINHSVGATVAALNKTSLDDVTAADTAALVTKLTLNPTTGDTTVVDKTDATAATYLAGTVIPEITSNNRVYILNRGTSTNLNNRNWIKMQITRNNNVYTVRYGTSLNTPGIYTTFTVTKDPSFNFVYTSFSSTTASYEPAKKLWDIAWGLSTYKITENGVTRAQPQPDFMLINFMANVTAAQVPVTATKNYANFTAADIPTATFSAHRDAIGGGWRNLTNSSTGALAINTSVFYLVKDAEGSVYKVNFAGGSRGNPVVQYIRLIDGTAEAGQ